ncbi:uncharacterized protein LOC130998363 [Salvia miltiorrhiza]|uniref:uncharacterized protein LOC130998363 n=1 Tax=Salvia miltiorrhiza TaxID=226208 RepID=UPI0025AB5F74|nr:uncharacterized protein LOC130998363 [Salvia miltiorrhiza]
MDKYFPISYREKKEIGFFELKQERMTIEEYERKFNELARFAPHLVDTEENMIAQFKRGLGTNIKGIMAAHVIVDFSELVKRAEEVEMALGVSNPTPKPANPIVKRRWENNNQSKENFRDKKQKFGFSTSTGPTRIKPQCQKCGKNHHGKCMLGKGICFYCREPGHTVNFCPKKKNKAPRGQKNLGEGKEPEKKRNARIFALAHQEPEQVTPIQ